MESRISMIALGVRDLPRSVKFYRNGLGFLPSSATNHAFGPPSLIVKFFDQTNYTLTFSLAYSVSGQGKRSATGKQWPHRLIE